MCLTLLFLTSIPVLAGGDYVLVKISKFSGYDGNYSMSFKQTEIDREPLLMGCNEFKVTVEYKNVPWYSWLPFVQSSHPTKQQTIKAASLLLDAFKTNRAISFGYMGRGLIPTGEKCSFSSKGLILEFNNVVLSFHDPV
jgi:hypothetical protein